MLWDEPGDSVFQLACTRDRILWDSGHRSGPNAQVLTRRWPFPDHPSEFVPGSPGAQALTQRAVDDHRTASERRLRRTGNRCGEVYNAALELLHTQPLRFPSDA